MATIKDLVDGVGLGVYKECWETETMDEAKRKVLFRLKSRIFKGRFKKEFEESGKREALALSEFVEKDAVALDLGCGVGRVAKYLAPFVWELHGIDVSEQMVQYAKNNCQKLSNVHFKVNNGMDLRLYPDNTFDFVYSLLMLQHLKKEDALNYIVEVYRVLKKDGRALLQFPNRSSPIYWICHLYNLIDRSPAKLRFYTQKEAESTLKKAGFRNIKKIALTKNEINLLATKSVQEAS